MTIPSGHRPSWWRRSRMEALAPWLVRRRSRRTSLDEITLPEGWDQGRRRIPPLGWRHAARGLGQELVEDSEAFLLGQYAARVEQRSPDVPAWARTNLLAHGSEDDLRRAAVDARRGPAESRGWRAARAFLAAEILRTIGPEGSLVELQRQVLAPLELELAGRPDVGWWSPQRWVVAVRSRLAAYRHSHRS